MSARTGSDPLAAPLLGVPRERRKRRPGEPPASIFEHDEEEMLKRGEATVEWVTAMYTRLTTEGSDMRRGAVLLGTVADAFPRLKDALAEASVAAENVEGVWVVPPFVLKGLPEDLRWHDVRGRLSPFLKNNLWRRIDAEVRAGRAVDFHSMHLQPNNLVIARHVRPWRTLLGAARRQLTWAKLRRGARDAYAGATREQCARLVVTLWPFPWGWLLIWILTDLIVLTSYAATPEAPPSASECF